MSDKELELYCEQIRVFFSEWIKDKDVLNTPYKELLEDAFFEGFKKGEKSK